MSADIETEILSSKMPIWTAYNAEGQEYRVYLNGRHEGFPAGTTGISMAQPLVKMLQSRLAHAESGRDRVGSADENEKSIDLSPYSKSVIAHDEEGRIIFFAGVKEN